MGLLNMLNIFIKIKFVFSITGICVAPVMVTLFIPPPKYSYIQPKILIIRYTRDKAYKLAIVDIPIKTNNSQFITNLNIASIDEEKFKIIFYPRDSDELVCFY